MRWLIYGIAVLILLFLALVVYFACRYMREWNRCDEFEDALEREREMEGK